MTTKSASLKIFSISVTAHNWQKCKSTYRIDAVGQKSSNYTLKNYDFCENVKFVAILWTFDILSLTA